MLLPDVSWATVEGFPRYAVNRFGEVMNLDTDRLLRPRLTGEYGGGYTRVALSHEGQIVDHYIHQLVAQAFMPGWREGVRILHINGDNADNSLFNLRLRYMPTREMRYIPRDGWGRRVRVVETDQVYRTVRECANHIGGDYSAIYSCLRGERNRHLGFTFEYLEEEK